MHTTEHTDLDGDALTVHRDKGLAWVTITRDGDEMTVGPVPAHALTGQHRGSHTRDEKRNAESCPLTPDAITDEMVEQARAAWINAGGRVYPGVTSDLRHALAAVLPVAPGAMTAREHLGAAWEAAHVPADGVIPAGAEYITRNRADLLRGPFTDGGSLPDTDRTGFFRRRLLDPPAPARPAGAEELGELIGTWTATEGIAPAQLPTGSLATLADFLAERGARVVSEEDPR